MAACYAPDARFSDPVFVDLEGQEPGAMWRMLTGRADDLKIELVEHQADGDRGSARWIAHYTFTQTGRPVTNDVRAAFRFARGLIAEHRDEFDFHRWSRQALGTLGPAARLDADPARLGAAARPRRPGRVHGRRGATPRSRARQATAFRLSPGLRSRAWIESATASSGG